MVEDTAVLLRGLEEGMTVSGLFLSWPDWSTACPPGGTGMRGRAIQHRALLWGFTSEAWMNVGYISHFSSWTQDGGGAGDSSSGWDGGDEVGGGRRGRR